jgi:acyl-[acyl-carrier-protein]-phospholipid O-acyltransferase/long-chain-fatty-acid--[acyl-carrier-protein] ligase
MGNIEGTAGHPIPGLAVKIVDLQTGEELSTNQPGLLFVKGPNVMHGYLNNPKETERVITDGWYNTGDIATLEGSGFITINDRLSRFSKIAGEMVPHWTVEEILQKALGTAEHVVSVVGIPDEKKGEELVVFYVEGSADGDKLHQIVTESTLPNLYKPRRENYVPIAKMPTLGSGKLDIAQLKKLALKLLPRFVSRNQ